MGVYRADELILSEMRKRGDRKFTYGEIAAAVGCTRKTVHNTINRLKREGISPPRSRGGAISVASKLYREIKSRGPGNYSVSDLSATVGASYSTTAEAITKLVDQGYIQREKARGRRAALLFSAALLLLQGTAIAAPSHTNASQLSAADCLRKRRAISRRGRRVPDELDRSPRRARRNRCGRAVFFAPNLPIKPNTTPPHTPRVREAWHVNATPHSRALCVRNYAHACCERPEHDEARRKFRSRGMAAQSSSGAWPPNPRRQGASAQGPHFHEGAYARRSAPDREPTWTGGAEPAALIAARQRWGRPAPFLADPGRAEALEIADRRST